MLLVFDVASGVGGLFALFPFFENNFVAAVVHVDGRKVVHALSLNGDAFITFRSEGAPGVVAADERADLADEIGRQLVGRAQDGGFIV